MYDGWMAAVILSSGASAGADLGEETEQHLSLRAPLPRSRRLDPMAATLYVASYAGLISQLSLRDSKLAHVSTTQDWDTSWLTLDRASGTLYSLGEGSADQNAPGSLSVFAVSNKDGSLTLRDKKQTINGPVSLVLFGPAANKTHMALAHYGGSSVSAFALAGDHQLQPQDHVTFPFPDGPGPNHDRQEASHPHGCTLDPSGKFVLVPDLGMDVVHVFRPDLSTGKLTECPPLRANAGSGPRHAVFWSPKGADSPLFLYLVGELTATVTGYQVSYEPDGSGMTFRELFVTSTLGDRKSSKPVLAAEIATSPDGRFLLVSNRFDATYASNDGLASDSIATWSLQTDGHITFVQLASAGGRVPRFFDISSGGDEVAVALQDDHRVAILKRDVETGLIGSELASTAVPDRPTCILWA